MEKKYKRIFILNENQVLRINSALAGEIGLSESIVLLQLEFLISISKNEVDGKMWTYQSAEDLKSGYFQFWSTSTIQRILKELENKKFIIKGNHNKRKSDRTTWYALNYDGLYSLKSIRIDKCEQAFVQNE
ncbi:MAG: hypothetical protein ACWGHO_04655 [Candidatus Moraniibacteriota bacterium]